MNSSDFQLSAISDPRLSHHATSALPAWLFAIDGSRVLWSNPPAARAFGATDSAQLAARKLGPADQHRRQAAQLARRLPADGAMRLERLRGFGMSLGMLATCACARLRLADGTEGILIAALDSVARTLPPNERLQRLVQSFELPAAVCTPDGVLTCANPAGRRFPGINDLVPSGLDQARSNALASGSAELDIDAGRLSLFRLGSGADLMLLAVLHPLEADVPEEITESPAAAHEHEIVPPAATGDASPDHQMTAVAEAPPAGPTLTTGEAPAEFALFDALEAPEDLPAEPTAPDGATVVVSPDEPPPVSYEQPSQSGEAAAEFALIEEFADSPSSDGASETASASDVAETVIPNGAHAAAVATTPIPATPPRRHPLRFTWRTDADGRFALAPGEFADLLGPVTAAGLDRPWTDIAASLGIDSDGQFCRALASRTTWSGIVLDWPVDGGERLRVELSGLPVLGDAQAFGGYRGFGVCRDLAALDRVAVLRGHLPKAGTGEPAPALPTAVEPARDGATAPVQPHDEADTADQPPELPGNVVPFRPALEAKIPTLTPVENNAFDELGRQLSFWLEQEKQQEDIPAVTETLDVRAAEITEPAPAAMAQAAAQPQPAWLLAPGAPARGGSRDRALFDLLPTGVLIYRLDRLVYANAAFLERMGHPSLQSLEEAGGIDALYVEAGATPSSSTSEAGTGVTVYATPESAPNHGRLFTIDWEGDQAHALILSAAAPAHIEPVALAPEPEPAAAPPAEAGQANAEDLGAILDMTAEGIIMFDGSGNIHACNRSAEALFAYDGAELVQRNLIELFATESRRVVLDYLENVKAAGVESLREHGREALGRVSTGGIIPLSVTIGRTRPDGPNFFAVFRDLSQTRKGESELQQARREAERAASARADLLARISHEIRVPLNSIIGFADVMIGERFGGVGNERYADYLKDIRASGERVLAMVNDLQELARIETGKLELAFTNQNLNELVENCVATMQPQANRQRIIIRSSLAQALPSIVADARALRQIALNLIGNSIELARPGGQVIVSTALNDYGEVVLRVRDTGHRAGERDAATAPESTADGAGPGFDAPGVNLSLTRALVEANRAQLNIRTASQAGTMIEVIFPHAMARA